MTELTMRAFRQAEDYWRIREFLRAIFRVESRPRRNWIVARFDYWRWHGVENILQSPLEEMVFIWETADGQIAAVLNPENRGEAFLQIDPGYRLSPLEYEMLEAAELHLAVTGSDGTQRLTVWAHEHDRWLQDALIQRGYRKGDWPEYQRWRSLTRPILAAEPAPGYTVRALGDRDELPARSWLSWRAFHPDEPHEDYEGWEWYHHIQRSPLYRRDLDLVAIAPGGEFAAFCTIWYDDVTRSGYVEPVGTSPDHRRRGLGRAVTLEGLHRLKRLGATEAYVGSYDQAAHALYASVGFTEYTLSERWTRLW